MGLLLPQRQFGNSADNADNLEEDAAQHGRQRRVLGYSVVPLLRELQIFRQVLLSMVEEIVGAAVSVGEIEQARNLIIEIVDPA